MSKPQARRMVCVTQYIAKNGDELTIKVNDVIFVPNAQKDANSMFTGVFGGKVGKFPSINVKDTTVEIKEAGKTTRVLATRGNPEPGKDLPEGELEFPKGAKMFVVAKVSDQHWKGVYAGKQGLIPTTHVHDASEAPKKLELAGMRTMAVKTLVSIADITAIAFKVGDIIFVPKADPDAAMWQGVSGGVVGLFDKTFVVDTKDKSKADLEEIKTKAAAADGEAAKLEEYKSVLEMRKQALEAASAPAGGDGGDDEAADI